MRSTIKPSAYRSMVSFMIPLTTLCCEPVRTVTTSGLRNPCLMLGIKKMTDTLNCQDVISQYSLDGNTQCTSYAHIDTTGSHFEFLFTIELADGNTVKVCSKVYGKLMSKLYGHDWVSQWVRHNGHLKRKKRYHYNVLPTRKFTRPS